MVVDFYTAYGGYPPYYGPGWGWGGYYPIYVQSYSKGTVLINMIDPDAIDNINKEVPRVWIGVLNGLAQGSVSSVAERIAKGIDKAFDQSPYLGGQ